MDNSPKVRVSQTQKHTNSLSLLLVLREALKKCAAISRPPGPHAVSRVAYVGLRPRTASYYACLGLWPLLLYVLERKESKWKQHLNASSRWGAMAIYRCFLLEFYKSITCREWAIKSIIAIFKPLIIARWTKHNQYPYSGTEDLARSKTFIFKWKVQQNILLFFTYISVDFCRKLKHISLCLASRLRHSTLFLSLTGWLNCWVSP